MVPQEQVGVVDAMTAFYPKSCPACGGDVHLIRAYSLEPDDRLVCFQCSRAISRPPKDNERLRALPPRYSRTLERRKAVGV